MSERKRVTCTVCDCACQLTADVSDGRVTKIGPSDNPLIRGNICMKGPSARKLYAGPDRLTKPLRRIGERGEHRWEEVSWDSALDEIAERLAVIVERDGPEAFAVAASNWNTANEHGLGRRFMNLLGSPNFISGVSMCMGNTSAVHRMTTGWFPFPDIINSDCVVLFGHNPRRHSWTLIYNMVRQAQARGAKLIVLDPRVSGNADRADMHLQLRSGTDTAMTLGWLNVIIEEKLYDERFVRDWTVGFDDLAERVREYPLERVSEITGVPAELIREAARTYATARAAVIPWTPITDKQVASTSAIRCHAILRAICGNLDVPGGEIQWGFNPSVIPEEHIEQHEALSQAQRDKQLGADTHPVYTHRGMAYLEEPLKRVWGERYANIVMGNYMANPTAVFRAMETGEPYPVKALFTLGNNVVMGYPNQQRIIRAFQNQELVVTHELFMTPTAALSDFILPGDTFLERPNIHDGFRWLPRIQVSEQASEPPGECRGVFDFWTGLAERMDLGEHFPWRSIEELLDYKLTPTGMSFAEYCDAFDLQAAAPEYRSYRKTGFATPSGKVELSSSVLEDLGFDPLPYHRELATSEEFPLLAFVGVREDPYFQTGQRQLAQLRRLAPLPRAFLHPDDAAAYGLSAGDWLEVITDHGAVSLELDVREDMLAGHVRVPHGWWFPELVSDLGDGGAGTHNDGMIVGDDPDLLDFEQGLPHFCGIPCRIERLDQPPAHIAASASAEYQGQFGRIGATR